MPSYLDLLFTFGRQKTKKNFNFSGFRSKEIVPIIQIGANAATNGVPDYKFQMCYNLRCVEPTDDPPEWPWSIRQTAIFHSFDLNSGDGSWILTKGSRDMLGRFQRITRTGAPSDPALFVSRSGAFAASLAAHLVLCEWSSENWADYIGYIEESLHRKTSYALLATIKTHKSEASNMRRPNRVFTSPPQKVLRRVTLSEFSKAGIAKFKNMMTQGSEQRHAQAEQNINSETVETIQEENNEYDDFSYDDLREIQFMEDQTNVCLLVIKSNISILGDLQGHYQALQGSNEFQMTFGNECDVYLSRFNGRVRTVVNDFKLQQSRLEALGRLIGDRKSLVRDNVTLKERRGLIVLSSLLCLSIAICRQISASLRKPKSLRGRWKG
jgi:hypothetical protein